MHGTLIGGASSAKQTNQQASMAVVLKKVQQHGSTNWETAQVCHSVAQLPGPHLSRATHMNTAVPSVVLHLMLADVMPFTVALFPRTTIWHLALRSRGYTSLCPHM